MRFICWLLIHSVYRLDKRGLDNIPEEGAAVIIANHVSFVDALVILAASTRPIRFVMDHNIFKVPVLSFVFRTGKAIPIASAKENEALQCRLRRGRQGVGGPPGGILEAASPITRLRSRAASSGSSTAVPGADGAKFVGSFSRMGGAAMTKPFAAAWSRIGLDRTAIAPAAATPEALQATVAELGVLG
jgi:1-acyl-sn-glycerol-3-phosphate acyltransferase